MGQNRESRNKLARNDAADVDLRMGGDLPPLFVLDAPEASGGCRSRFHDEMFKELRRLAESDASKAELIFIDVDTMKMVLWPDYYHVDSRCGYNWVRGEDTESSVYMRKMEEFLSSNTLGRHQYFVYFDNEQSTRTENGAYNYTQFRYHPMHKKLAEKGGGKVKFVELGGVKPDANMYGTTNLIVPILDRYILEDYDEATTMALEFEEREFLATFHGRGERNHAVRGGVLNLRRSISPSTGCTWGPCKLDLVDTTATAHDEHDEYVTSLKNSQFCFCPRGNNHFSLRIAEALRFGAIPVIIDDLMAEPFNVDIKAWAVVVPESKISTAGEILANIPKDDRLKLARAGKSLYRSCVASIEGVVECMLKSI